MAEITIIQDDKQDQGHCPTCEARFMDLEKRIASIEAHHPIMDKNTEDAQEKADEAVEMAEKALETAQSAAVIATLAAVETTHEEEEEKEVIPDAQESSERDTGTEGEETQISEGIQEEQESAEPEPTLIAIEPEPKPEQRKPSRFARGRR